MYNKSMTATLGSSAESQKLLRPITLWAAHYVEQVLPIFETTHPDEPTPRKAVEAALEFGNGRRRDNTLRAISMSAFKLGKTTAGSAKYVTRAACAVAAIAYTHTDLTTGTQGVRQAQHILGPIVYAALALGEDSDRLVKDAIANAPPEVGFILQYMPSQPAGKRQEDVLFFQLDANLRHNK